VLVTGLGLQFAYTKADVGPLSQMSCTVQQLRTHHPVQYALYCYASTLWSRACVCRM